MQREDEEALDKENEEFDPPFKAPTQAVCEQFWASMRGGPAQFESSLQELPYEGWCVTRLQCSSTERGQNYLHIAAEIGDWRVFSVLQRILPSHHGTLPLYVSIPRRRLPVQPDVDGNTPLHIAAIHDNLDLTKTLLEYYHNYNIPDPWIRMLHAMQRIARWT
ncbi:Putative ankyrin repeat-containing domain superfamily [Septoria linicola]|uniref:Ankyrin repeat-containing domain superfamily n=1 Tax=Septoria linicola TaxID=215465 RepID=A0A9Q9AJI8_9PEZI|nr:putative ankyrin repeat-containing domain superfamily [Septoria linicola]USW50512.1 Putative ankyrin repeat-containing domain superfamily [Septoria linicola]